MTEISQKSHPGAAAIPRGVRIPLTFIKEMSQLQNFEIVVLGQKKMWYCKRASLVMFPDHLNL